MPSFLEFKKQFEQEQSGGFLEFKKSQGIQQDIQEAKQVSTQFPEGLQGEQLLSEIDIAQKGLEPTSKKIDVEQIEIEKSNQQLFSVETQLENARKQLDNLKNAEQFNEFVPVFNNLVNSYRNLANEFETDVKTQKEDINVFNAKVGQVQEAIDRYNQEITPEPTLLDFSKPEFNNWLQIEKQGQMTPQLQVLKNAGFGPPKPEKTLEALLEPTIGDIKTTTPMRLEPGRGQRDILGEISAQHEETKISTGIKVYAQGLTKLPKQYISAVVTGTQGWEGASVVDRTWGDRLVQSASEDAEKFVAEMTEKYKDQKFLPGISIEDVASLPESMAFSLAALTAGGITAAPLLFAPEPIITKVTGIVAGMAAGGAIAYNMATYQFMQEYLEIKNEEMQATQGRDMTLFEENQFKDEMSGLAKASGLWEAIPEAIAGGADIALMLIPAGVMVKLLGAGGKSIVIRILTKLAGMFGGEIITEAITELKQMDIRAEAGLPGGKETDWKSGADWIQAFKAVAPQTILLVTTMGGFGGVAIKTKAGVQKVITNLKNEVGERHPLYEKFVQKIRETSFGLTIEDISKKDLQLAKEAGMTEQQFQNLQTNIKEYQRSGVGIARDTQPRNAALEATEVESKKPATISFTKAVVDEAVKSGELKTDNEGFVTFHRVGKPAQDRAGLVSVTYNKAVAENFTPEAKDELLTFKAKPEDIKMFIGGEEAEVLVNAEVLKITRAEPEVAEVPVEGIKVTKPELLPKEEGKKVLQQDFQERVTAGQDLIEELKGAGIKKTVNSDGTITVFHGTSNANAEAIEKSGKINDQTFFSPNKKGTEFGDSPLGVAKRKFGKEGTVIEIKIDPRDIGTAAAGSELFTEKQLIRGEDGIWRASDRLFGEALVTKPTPETTPQPPQAPITKETPEVVEKPVIKKEAPTEAITEKEAPKEIQARIASLISEGKSLGEITLPSQTTSAELFTRLKADNFLSKISASTKPFSSVSLNIDPSSSTNFGKVVSAINKDLTPLNSLYTKTKDNVKPYLDILEEVVGNNKVFVDTKTPESIVSKVIRKQDEGNVNYSFKDVPDVLRGRIVFDNEQSMKGIVDKLGDKVIETEDFFATPSILGYRGVNINLKMPNGQITELQLHTEKSIKVQEKIAPIYKKWRGKDIPLEVIENSRKIADDIMKEPTKLPSIKSKEPRVTELKKLETIEEAKEVAKIKKQVDQESPFNDIITGKRNMRPTDLVSEWREILGKRYSKIFKTDQTLETPDEVADSFGMTENQFMEQIEKDIERWDRILIELRNLRAEEKDIKLERVVSILKTKIGTTEKKAIRTTKKVEQIVAKRQVAVEKREAKRQVQKTAVETRQKILTDIREKTETVELIKQDIKDFAQKLPLSERGKLLATIKNAKTFDDLIVARAFIERLEEESAKRQLRTQIKKELKKTKVKKVGGKPVGKFTPETQKLLDNAREISRLSTPKAEERFFNNLEKYAETVPPVEIALENTMLDSLTGTREQLESFLKFVQDTKEKGATGFALKQFNRQEEINAKRNLVLDRVTGGKGIEEGRETFGPTRKKIRGKIKASLQTLGKRWISDWQGLMNMLDWKSSVNDKVLEKTFNLTEQENTYKALQETFIKDISNAISTSYGIKNKPLKINKKIIEMSKPIDLGFVKNTSGIGKKLELTKFEIIKRWEEFQDPTLEDSFELGNKFTPEIRQAITDQMTEQDIAYAKEELKLYKKQWEKINPIYRDINGVDLPFNEFYSPIRREGFKEGEVGFGEFLNEAIQRQALTSSSFTTRVENALPIARMSSIEVLERHIKETNYYVAWAEKMRELDSIFRNQTTREAIKQEFNRELNTAIDNNITDLMSHGNRRSGRFKPVDFFRKNFAVAKLMAKPSIGVKQMVSTIAYLEKIGPIKLSTGILDFFKHPLQNYKTLQKESDFIRTRGANMERDIKAAMQSDTLKAFSKKQSAINTLMISVKMGDKGAIVLGSWAMRRAGLGQLKPLQSVIAEYEDFSSATQQSADISRLSEVQRGGSFQQFFTLFKSSQRQYLQKELNAVKSLFQKDGFTPKNIAKVARILAIYHVLLPVMFQMVANLGGWDEDDQKEYLRAGLLGSINGLFIFGDAIDSVIRQVMGLRVWDNEIPIFDIVDDINKGIRKLDFDDVTLEDMLDALKEWSSAGSVIGLPVDQTKNIFEGFGNIIDGNVKNGIFELLGWSPFFVEETKKPQAKQRGFEKPEKGFGKAKKGFSKPKKGF